MEPMRRLPRLQKRGHRFYCRAVVPRELRPIIGKAEIIRPLKTGDYEEAVQRLPLASAQVNAELAAARRRLSAVPTTTLSDHDARQIVLRWFWREERRQVDAEAASDQETWLGLEEAIAENQLDLTTLKDPDDPAAGSSVQQRVERLLNEYNLRLEQNGSEISRLRDLVRRAMIERTRRGIDQLRGDFPKPRDPLFADVFSEGAAPERPKRSEVTQRQLVDMYLEDPIRQAGATADHDYQVMLRLIGEFISPVRRWAT
ncbi:MAG TPA: DUF6538 domain-containing protein [Kiloniellales bacterium]|nr:DUF6538 domain-containing protein [Kiloniellales bacterium]